MTLYGYDIDGVADRILGFKQPCVFISGRTFAEYDGLPKNLAQQAPVYIRGVGEFRDHQHSGEFKAAMINMLGVTEFYEDRDDQIAIIQKLCPGCSVVKVDL